MRYANRTKKIIDRKRHKHLLKKRNLDFAEIYESAKFKFLTDDEKSLISSDVMIWQFGDKMHKVALEYYGNMDDWWVIALFNNTPTEHHIKAGDEIYIPYPLHLVKELYGV